MALWLCRAGKMGEYETQFLENKRIYCTWDGLDWDMSKTQDRELFKQKVQDTYPDKSVKTIQNWTGQLWAFSHSIAKDDLIALPSKIRQTVHFGVVSSKYQFNFNPNYVEYPDEVAAKPAPTERITARKPKQLPKYKQDVQTYIENIFKNCSKEAQEVMVSVFSSKADYKNAAIRAWLLFGIEESSLEWKRIINLWVSSAATRREGDLDPINKPKQIPLHIKKILHCLFEFAM